MALGNSMNIGKARGKGRAVLVKRKKEVDTAENFYLINSSARLEVDLLSVCGTSPSINQTYYYNGANSFFPSVNDIIYTSKRATDPNVFTPGNYKMTRNGSQFVGLTVNSSGKVTHRANCR